MPEMVPVSDEEYKRLKNNLRIWFLIALAGVLLIVITLSLIYFETDYTIIFRVLMPLQLGVFIVAVIHFLKSRKFIKELRHRARNT